MTMRPDAEATETEPGAADHWRDLARQWRQVGPPLRPAEEDIGFCWEAVRAWIRRGGAPRVLLLGLTPELFRLPWPAGTDLLAVDRSPHMIENVWPGPREAVLCADWLSMALPEASRDVALCDGGLHLLEYPAQQKHLVGRLGTVISDGGLCVLRLYVPPRRQEAPDAVIEDLRRGRVPDVNALKLRLGMALMDGPAAGVALSAIWNALHDAAPDLEALARRLGWPAEHLLSIAPYLTSTARYHFVSVEEACELFCEGPFEVQDVRVPSYPLGDRCPTVVFRRRSRAR